MIANYDSHAANERTFLAWVRTAMAVVGFGLAAGRLSDRHESLEAELALLAAGALVIMLAFVRMRRIAKRIDVATTELDDPAYVDYVLMALIGSLFALMALFAINVG